MILNGNQRFLKIHKFKLVFLSNESDTYNQMHWQVFQMSYLKYNFLKEILKN